MGNITYSVSIVTSYGLINKVLMLCHNGSFGRCGGGTVWTRVSEVQIRLPLKPKATRGSD